MKKLKNWKTTIAGLIMIAGTVAMPFVKHAETREAIAAMITLAGGGGLFVAADGAKNKRTELDITTHLDR